MNLKISSLVQNSCHREYSQSWNAALYNEYSLVLREAPVVQKGAEKNCIFHGQRKGTTSENVQIKILLDVLLLFGALGSLDKCLMNMFL